MDPDSHRQAARQMRQIFKSLDLLGFQDFSDDEYDVLADGASSVLANNGTVDEAVQRVADRLRTEWDTELSAPRSQQLRDALSNSPQ